MKKRYQWHRRNCRECDREFRASRYDATYCGDACRQRARRARAKRRKSEEAVNALDWTLSAFILLQPQEWREDFYKFVEGWPQEQIAVLVTLMRAAYLNREAVADNE